jgi:hypothetical protein
MTAKRGRITPPLYSFRSSNAFGRSEFKLKRFTLFPQNCQELERRSGAFGETFSYENALPVDRHYASSAPGVECCESTKIVGDGELRGSGR